MSPPRRECVWNWAEAITRCLVSRQTRQPRGHSPAGTQVGVSHFLSHTACLESPLSVGNETVIGMTAILGYARVSTSGQDLDAQLAALIAAGVDTERVFATSSLDQRTHRPGLTSMLEYARAGDTVVVTAIDRLGRSVAEYTRTIAEFGERQSCRGP